MADPGTKTVGRLRARTPTCPMYVKLMTLEASAMAAIRLEDTGIGYLSIHINILPPQNVFCFLLVSKVQDYRELLFV